MAISAESANGFSISFRIRFRGELSLTWFATLQDVTLISTRCGKTIETMIAGEAPDEGAILGILNMLYDLGCSIISVETFKTPSD